MEEREVPSGMGVARKFIKQNRAGEAGGCREKRMEGARGQAVQPARAVPSALKAQVYPEVTPKGNHCGPGPGWTIKRLQPPSKVTCD